jgi:hypothetical protein
MRVPKRETGLIVMGLLLWASPLFAAPPAEVKKLHVLLVFDTSDETLGDSLARDQLRIRELFKNTIPRNRLNVSVLTGKKVTADQILDHYRKANPDRNDGLLFFYGGHGATDPTKKHFFQLACGDDLPRSRVRKAMEAKKTALVVLLTDCCSTPEKIGTPVQPRLFEEDTGPKEIHPTVRCLLFKARGTVDVTAATNAPSWSDNLEGGVFTRTLCATMNRSMKSLGQDDDGIITWREFFPVLQSETEKVFANWSAKMRTIRGVKIDSRTQKPSAFALGNDLAAGRTYAVVGIENATNLVIAYRFRWSGEQDWKYANLEVGEKKPHALQLKDEKQSLPKLEVEIHGRKMMPLKSGKWTGEGNPSFEDGRSYRLRPRKKD